MTRFFLLFLVALVACGREAAGEGRFGPAPTAAAPGLFDSFAPAPVGFLDLNDMPDAYRHRLIRVTGALRRLPLPDCAPSRGPRTTWALVEEGLRLEARGLEEILALPPRDTVITVDGVWRLYVGPLGCGKEPATGSAWYLEALRVIAPNPLPGFGPLPTPTQASGPALGPPPALPTATPSPEPSITPGPTPSPTFTPTPTVTPGPGTPTVTAAPTVTFTPTRPPTRTPLASATPPPSLTPSPTGTSTVTPSPGATSPGGGFATATPGLPQPTFTPGVPYPQPTLIPSPTSPYP